MDAAVFLLGALAACREFIATTRVNHQDIKGGAQHGNRDAENFDAQQITDHAYSSVEEIRRSSWTLGLVAGAVASLWLSDIVDVRKCFLTVMITTMSIYNWRAFHIEDHFGGSLRRYLHRCLKH